MPRFAFQVRPGQFPERLAIEDVLIDHEAARKAALGMCADPAKDIRRLDVLNGIGEPIFRLRVLVETLEPAS
jgi:hypothetical protein